MFIVLLWLFECPGFQESAESREIAIRNVDDFLADVDAVVAVDFTDFVDGNNIGTVYAQEFFFGQHLLDGFHRQVGNERFGLVVEVEQHVVFHAIDIDDVVNIDVLPLAIDTDEYGVGNDRFIEGYYPEKTEGISTY